MVADTPLDSRRIRKRNIMDIQPQKRGTSWKPRRFARLAAGIAVAAITVAGIGAAAGGASASTGWGNRMVSSAPVSVNVVVVAPDLTPMSTGWGA